MTTETKKKFPPWLIGIILTYVTFMVFFLGFLFFSMTQRVDLVEEDYYEQELKHQQRIDAVNRTQSLPVQPHWKYIPADRVFRLQFPPELASRQVEGTIEFFRPSDARQDFSIPLDLDAQGEQIVELRQLSSGFWRVLIEWQMDELDYFNEAEVVLK